MGDTRDYFPKPVSPAPDKRGWSGLPAGLLSQKEILLAWAGFQDESLGFGGWPPASSLASSVWRREGSLSPARALDKGTLSTSPFPLG